MRFSSIIPFGKKQGRDEERYDPFSIMRDEIDSIFNRTIQNFNFANLSTYGIKVDIHDKGSEIKINSELPGVKEEDIEVSLNNNFLSIQAEKKYEKEESGESCYMMEREYGKFRRTIQLPFIPQSNKISATLKDGLLSIIIPKPEEAVSQHKRIQVSSS